MNPSPMPLSGDDLRPDSSGDRHPLDALPRVSSLAMALRRIGDPAALLPGIPAVFGMPEVVGRASGLGRAGVVAQIAWTRLGTRVGVGLDTPLAHAIVDALLGFDRLPGEAHLQITPVEWGILGFAFARALDRLDARPGPLGPWDLTIDRLGPDPFDARDLGPILTWRWPVRMGAISGSARLWLPESLLSNLDRAPSPASEPRAAFATLGSTWRAEAGTTSLSRGLPRLRRGGVLPIDDNPLRGTVASPSGPIALTCLDRDGRSWFDAEAVPGSSAARLTLRSRLRREPTPREPIAVDSTPSSSHPSPTPANPADVPVTLVVELGRVNLPLSRLADLRPGDVVDLGRHSREPVELTSNGRLVARGELVQIDTELGVRVTNVFI